MGGKVFGYLSGDIFLSFSWLEETLRGIGWIQVSWNIYVIEKKRFNFAIAYVIFYSDIKHVVNAFYT